MSEPKKNPTSPEADDYQDREGTTLRRLLATPPDPKRKTKPNAEFPKKRGRPPKALCGINHGDQK